MRLLLELPSYALRIEDALFIQIPVVKNVPHHDDIGSQASGRGKKFPGWKQVARCHAIRRRVFFEDQTTSGGDQIQVPVRCGLAKATCTIRVTLRRSHIRRGLVFSTTDI